MLMKTQLSVKIASFLTNINSIIEELIRRSLARNGYLPALAEIGSPQSNGSNFDLKEIFEKGIVWCPVPKKRTTAEKKLTKRFLPLPNNFITKYAKPKTNIITCLECGGYHEIGTICGKCYEKVKKETEQAQEALFKKDEFKYSYPAKEIKFVYEDDKENSNQNESKNQILIEIPKKRPSWFNNNLLSKVSTKVK